MVYQVIPHLHLHLKIEALTSAAEVRNICSNITNTVMHLEYTHI